MPLRDTESESKARFWRQEVQSRSRLGCDCSWWCWELSPVKPSSTVHRWLASAFSCRYRR